MTIVMKYPTGRHGSDSSEGEIHCDGGKYYLEECESGAFFRMYGSAAVEHLRKKDVKDNQRVVIDKAISLLKSKTDAD